MKITTLLLVLISLHLTTFAQDDLLSLLPSDKPEKEYVKNAFKATRVINGHSMEMLAAGVLDFRIQHRFGNINGGAYEFFGLDQASTHLSLDYSIFDRLTVGIGRGTLKKEADGYIKYKLLWQAEGPKASPVSVLLVSGMTINGLKFSDTERNNHFSNRLAYFHQVVIGRKFSDAFSFQLSPSVLHRNLVLTNEDPNDVFGLGAGTRVKISPRVAITADYYHSFNKGPEENYSDYLAIGFDIETGGHVFQLHFSNSSGMNERAYMTETFGEWEEGDIHFGFNITRVFTLNKKKRKVS